jgi:hypothetical protein
MNPALIKDENDGCLKLFFKKINMFQASYNFVHIICGQGVEKHVNKHIPERQDNCFYTMHNI